MRRTMMGRITLGAILFVLGGCSADKDDTGRPRRDAGPRIDYHILRADNGVGFEGTRRFITSFSALDGTVDLSAAVLSVPDETSGVRVVESRCNRARCGVVLELGDRSANTGIAIPAPIDARNASVLATTLGGIQEAQITIFPLDALQNASATPAPVHDTVLIATAQATSISTFRAAPGGPVRWVSFGDAGLHGTIGLSADGAMATVGGANGGGAGASAAGAGAGAAGSAGAGGGGGGNAGAGANGQGADGIADAGGRGGAAQNGACAVDLEAATCGGGGGGGAGGAGGAGGGTFVLLSLGALDLSGLRIAVAGAAGTNGGGGGAGGNIVIAAPSWTPPAELSVSGGAGAARETGAGGRGGAGASGHVRLEIPGATWPMAELGATVDVSDWSALVTEPTTTVHGTAPRGAQIRVEMLDLSGGDARVVGRATADEEGAFAIDVALEPGLSRLRVFATDAAGERRLWTGTSFEFRQRLPIGGALDVVYIPDTE